MSEDFDLVDSLISYENGALDEDQEIELYQHMVDSGVVWQLQGSYGRRAEQLINAGKVRLSRSENISINQAADDMSLPF